jgi:hypothetical protein
MTGVTCSSKYLIVSHYLRPILLSVRNRTMGWALAVWPSALLTSPNAVPKNFQHLKNGRPNSGRYMQANSIEL